MTGEHGDALYSLGLLRDVTRWSVPVAVAAAIVGSAFTHDARFGISCALGAGVDIGTLAWALRRTRDIDAHEALASGPLLNTFLFRLTVKAVLLVAAVLLPALLDLWGAVAGVLTVDMTIATAGSAAAAWHTFRPHRSGG